MLAEAASSQVVAAKADSVSIPPNLDPFNLSFEDFKKYSSMKDFELVGHSYFKVPERTDYAKGLGRPGGETGSGFNTVRVYDGTAYLAGYNSPPTLFGVLIADVHDPKNMKPLSFIPCNLFIKKDCFLKVGGYDSRFFDGDMNLYFREDAVLTLFLSTTSRIRATSPTFAFVGVMLRRCARRVHRRRHRLRNSYVCSQSCSQRMRWPTPYFCGRS